MLEMPMVGVGGISHHPPMAHPHAPLSPHTSPTTCNTDTRTAYTTTHMHSHTHPLQAARSSLQGARRGGWRWRDLRRRGWWGARRFVADEQRASPLVLLDELDALVGLEHGVVTKLRRVIAERWHRVECICCLETRWRGWGRRWRRWRVVDGRVLRGERRRRQLVGLTPNVQDVLHLLTAVLTTTHGCCRCRGGRRRRCW